MGRLNRNLFLHPVQSARGFLRRCSMRTAFAVYAVAAMAISSLAAFSAWYLPAVAADNVYYNERSVQSGFYIYDAGRGALIPAEQLDWLKTLDSGYDELSVSVGGEGGVYVSTYTRDSRYEQAIVLGPQTAALKLHIEDVDAVYEDNPDGEVSAEYSGEVALADLPEYDAAANERRGGTSVIEDALAEFDGGSSVTVSRVGYYVYAPPPALWRVLNVVALLVIPVVFIFCFAMVTRAFYRNKFERPIAVMGDAAHRIAAGDLDFSLPATPEGTRDELDRLCAAFETMRAELERANRESWRQAEARRRGNAAFAHDMRTPLTVLKGRAEMLSAAASTDTLDAAKVASDAQVLASQVQRLESYVESMRQLAVAQDCPVVPRPTGMQTWFSACVASVEDAVRAVRARELGEDAAEAEVASQATGLPTVALMDEAVVSRVVENMVGNAARFAVSKIRVSATWRDGVLTVCVEDDGPGFAEAALEHACDAYWRQGSADGGEGHVGLGLSICSGLCVRHGGSFQVANGEDGGAQVCASFHAPAFHDDDSSCGVGRQ